MKDADAAERVRELAEPLAEALGLSVWGVEVSGPRGKRLARVFVDAEGGATVGNCAALSRDLDPALEAENAVRGGFTLEVSTPGIERKFFSPEQLAAYEGRAVAAVTREPVEGQRKFQGTLTGVKGETVAIQTAAGPMAFEFPDLKSIRLVHDFGGKPKGAKATHK